MYAKAPKQSIFSKFKETHARNSPEKQPQVKKAAGHTKVVRRATTRKSPKKLVVVPVKEDFSLKVPNGNNPFTPVIGPNQMPYSPCIVNDAPGTQERASKQKLLSNRP